MPMNKYIEEYIEARKRELTKKESNEKEKLIKKLFKDKSAYRKVDQILFSTKVELGLSIGKSPRAVIGIKDKNLSQKILELM